MSERAVAVLYDNPGPRAKRINLIVSIVFGLLLALGLYWVIKTLADNNQLTAEKWSPIIEGQNWTTYLLPGLWATLQAAALSLVLSLPIGALLGVGRLSDFAWVRWPCAVFVEFFRSVPVLILMLFAFQLWFTIFGTSSPFAGVVIGLVLYNASVLAEVFRAGIQSVPRGQSEAALAIGLRKSQIMSIILLPQALTAMLPAIVSQLVVIVKDTALGGILVGYTELRRAAGTSASNYGNVVATYITIAVVYIVLNMALVGFANRLEQWTRRKRGTSSEFVETGAVGEAELNVPGVPAGRERV